MEPDVEAWLAELSTFFYRKECQANTVIVIRTRSTEMYIRCADKSPSDKSTPDVT